MQVEAANSCEITWNAMRSSCPIMALYDAQEEFSPD